MLDSNLKRVFDCSEINLLIPFEKLSCMDSKLLCLRIKNRELRTKDGVSAILDYIFPLC